MAPGPAWRAAFRIPPRRPRKKYHVTATVRRRPSPFVERANLVPLTSSSMSGSATNRRVLRNLDHLWQGMENKFMNKMRPSYAQSTPAFVPKKDRIAFWNIVPGDVVKLRTGAVGHDENGRPIRGEGIVTTVDRTNNRIFLRDIDVRAPYTYTCRTTTSWHRKTSSMWSRVSLTPRQETKKGIRAT